MANDLKYGLWARLVAKPGKEAEVEKLLKGAVAMVADEPNTAVWFALKLDSKTFGIFDGFVEESGRKEHLNGRIAAALKEKASELLAEPPKIENVDLLASRIASEEKKKAA